MGAARSAWIARSHFFRLIENCSYLKEICQKVTLIAGLREYCEWVRGAAHLSEAALCEYLSGAGLSEDVCFKKADRKRISKTMKNFGTI